MKASIFLIWLLPIIISAYNFDPKDVHCAVCRVFIKEFQKAVDNVNEKKTIEVGGYKMGADGNVVKKKKLLVESEIYLSELLESTCNKLDDYVRGLTKDTGKLVLVNLMDTTSRPGLGDVDIIQDGDLNRSLPHLCKGIIEEFEDDIIESFVSRNKKPIDNVCVVRSELCRKEQIEGDEEEEDDDDEDYDKDEL